MSKLAVKVESLWFRYPTSRMIFEDLNLEIEEGEFLAIIGPSGAGKTTLVKHFNGLLKPLKGRVIVFGMDTKKTATSTLARRVGYVFQNPDQQIFARTIFEELSFGLKNLGYPKDEIRPRIEWALRMVDLAKPLDYPPHFLSFGEKHRLAIATVLAMKPDLIILDEPFSGLDYKRSLQLLEVFKRLNEEEGRTIVLIAHDLQLISRFAKRVVVLCDGKIVADGKVERILSDVDLLRKHGFIPLQITLLARGLGLGGEIVRIPDFVAEVARGHPTVSVISSRPNSARQ